LVCISNGGRMISYQHLDRYKGSLYGNLQYNGIEYDWETPDNQVISSPGGVSGIHHHYTKGMYSPESSYSDIYGGERPAYVYGEFGNLYQVGQSAPYYMGEYKQPVDKTFTQNQGLMRKDNFAPVEQTTPVPIEFIAPPDSNVVSAPQGGTDPKMKNLIVLSNPVAIFISFFLLWLALDFWVYGGQKFIVSTFHGGKELNWKWYLFYAVVFTLIFFLVAKYFDISTLSLEQT
jgi:hypothetical protein